MVEWEQPVADVCVTTRKSEDARGQYASKKLPKRKVKPTKGHRIKWEKEKLIHNDVVNELWRIDHWKCVWLFHLIWNRPSQLLN
jgi:hypothetical protein